MSVGLLQKIKSFSFFDFLKKDFAVIEMLLSLHSQNGKRVIGKGLIKVIKVVLGSS